MAQSRFWWRALDAPSPGEPDAATAAPPNRPVPAHVWHFPTRARPQQNSRTLEIPKTDRRPARRNSGQRAARRVLVLTITGFSVAAAGAAAFLLAPGLPDREKLEVSIGVAAQGALLALGFGLDQVSVTGHQFTSDRDVYEALELDRARTLASFDAAAALKRIEGLPWVETAQITRVFPGSLKVEIRERRPSALWSKAGKTYLIDATGRVLGLAAEPQSWQLPRVAGEAASNEAALLFATLERYPAIQREVAVGERKGERRWSLALKNGTRLELGADRETEGLDLIVRHTELMRALAGPAYVVDVRTPGRPVVRPLATAVPLSAAGNRTSMAGAPK